MRIIRSIKKKKEATADSTSHTKHVKATFNEDFESNENINALNSSVINQPLPSKKDKDKDRKEKKKKSRSDASQGKAIPPTSTPAEWLSVTPIKVVKTVTFKDE